MPTREVLKHYAADAKYYVPIHITLLTFLRTDGDIRRGVSLKPPLHILGDRLFILGDISTVLA